jgi:hypothetical protein
MRVAPGFLSVVGGVALVLTGADWNRFRGPDGRGVSADKDTPITWGAEENVAWKTPLPGPGASSPILVNGKIFLTCYSGYGLDEDSPGDPQNLKLHLVALSPADGRVLWDTTQDARLPEQDFRGFIALHGYASATPTSDGQLIYVSFGHSGVFAYTQEGGLVWKADVGSRLHGWGSAASPIGWKNLVLVNASVESDSLVALDKATGKEVWRVGGIKRSWSTPLVVDVPDGGQELVIPFENRVLGLDPATGNQLWECAGVKGYLCPSVVADKGIVYIGGAIKGHMLAIRAGGRGDVTKTHVLWELNKAPKVGTPLLLDGYLYWLSHDGIVACVKAQDGAPVYQQRLALHGKGDKAYASLIVADGKLYAVTRTEGTLVLAPGPTFTELAQNGLNDKSTFNATPLVVDGRLLLRSNRYLYCIGKRR